MAAASFPDGILTPLTLGPPSIIKTSTAFYSLLSYTGTITGPGITNLQTTGFNFQPTVSWDVAQSFATIPAFYSRPNFAPSMAVTDVASIFTAFYAQPTFAPTAVVGSHVLPLLAGYSADFLSLTRAGSATPTISEVVAFNARDPVFSLIASVGAGVTVAKLVGLRMGNAGGAGTVTELVGIDLDSLTKGGTNLSLRSAGASVGMRHAGSAVFGANAAPTNASVILEAVSTTQAFLLPRVTNTAAVVTPVNGMVIYDVALNTPRVFAAGAWRSI